MASATAMKTQINSLSSILCIFVCLSFASAQQKLRPHKISLDDGRKFTLKLPPNFEITPAAQRFRRPRFLAQAPDGRYFVTDMYSKNDNKKGTVYVLGRLNRMTGKFGKPKPYLTNLRNPNSVAFYVDKRNRAWFYVAETDKLTRYRYITNSSKPSGKPRVLATFPSYGLGYKYGGWHLTRTLAVGSNHKIYISVGSSCDSCEEKPEEKNVRAVVLEMNPNGSGRRVFARNVRNAVGLKWINGSLYATLQGTDHLGLNSPDETLHRLRSGADYGWAKCVQHRGKIIPDPKYVVEDQAPPDCSKVPASKLYFRAHSSALGFDYFGKNSDKLFRNAFLVALHGSTRRADKRGYKIVIAREGEKHRVLLDGFRKRKSVVGRPCDIEKVTDSSFLFTDDRAGVIYYVKKKPA